MNKKNKHDPPMQFRPKNNSKETNRTYVFCFLDILGYKGLVNNVADNKEAILKLEEFLNNSVFEMYDKFCNIRTGIKGRRETRAILKKIRISLISDSILIRMPIITSSDELHKKHSTTEIWVFMFFISFLILTFITNIGLFIRGGISIGQHYEKRLRSDSLFIFSKSLIQAYQLETKAKTIRILVDPELINFLAENNKDFTVEQYRETFYKDSESEYCLDYYDIMKSDEMRNQFLKGVLERVEMNLLPNKSDERIIEKYSAFANYHNEKTKQFNLPQYELNLMSILN